MTPNADPRQDLLRYISGQLAGNERVLFEERLMTDHDFSDEVAQQEQELIDNYALGRLNPEEAASVRSWIEASPRRLQRAEMAKALLARRTGNEHSKWRVAFVLAAAACLLAAVGISLMPPWSALKRTSKALATGTVARSTPQLNRATSLSPPSHQKPEVILLIAERIRGQQPIASYRISDGTPIKLEILLAGRSATSNYTLTILSLEPRQHVLVRQENLKALTKGKHVYLEATLSVVSLPPGKYRVLVGNGESMLSADFAIN